MANVERFENVKIVSYSITNPNPVPGCPAGVEIYHVTGVAIITFRGSQNGFNRDSVTFRVPVEGQTDPNAEPIAVPNLAQSSAIAFPATIAATLQGDVGWGVDSVEVGPSDRYAQVTAHLATLNPGSTILRMGFQVNLLACLVG